MNSKQRVLAACRFETPDRIPRHEPFWNYTKEWEDRFGPLEDLTDTAVWIADESPFPSRAKVIKEESGWIYQVNSWGQTTRHNPDAYFAETFEVAAPEGTDIDKLQFESPLLESRYDVQMSSQEMVEAKERQCVFAKTGGPYLRTTLLRGQEQFLMDIAADPEFAYALASKVADHLTVVGVEQIRRWNLQETGIWIFDDFASSKGPMMSGKSFEKIFFPIYKRMIKAYKDAGAKYVFLHCDGYPLPVFDMLIEAGFDGSHPIERRAGMDAAKIREMYPNFILIGAMDNIHTMVEGPVEKIRAETRELIDLGRDGGLIIGFHSVGPDVPMDHYAAYLDECLKYGSFSQKDPTTPNKCCKFPPCMWNCITA